MSVGAVHKYVAHVLAQTIMAARACGKEVPYLTVDRKWRERKRPSKTCTVAYFL